MPPQPPALGMPHRHPSHAARRVWQGCQVIIPSVPVHCRAARGCTRVSPMEAGDAERGSFAKSRHPISSPMLRAQTRDLGTSTTTWCSTGPAIRGPAGRRVLPFQSLILSGGIPTAGAPPRGWAQPQPMALAAGAPLERQWCPGRLSACSVAFQDLPRASGRGCGMPGTPGWALAGTAACPWLSLPPKLCRKVQAEMGDSKVWGQLWGQCSLQPCHLSPAE